MSRHPDLQKFLDRYFMVFLAGYFLSLYAMAGTFSLVWSTYCRDCSREINYPLSLGVLVVALVTAHAAVVRGRDWGVWVVAALCIGSVVFLLPTYGFRPHMGIFLSIIVVALLALLVLNSKRYRAMRVLLVGYRHKRQAERASKAQRPKVRRSR